MADALSVETNALWNAGGGQEIRITVFTPVYNRLEFLSRVISSVERQTMRQIEYIIINNGSTKEAEAIDSTIRNYMNEATIPVMYINIKENRGPHGARNLGWKNARGALTLCIDDDDELLPEACETFWRAWSEIPESERPNYWQIKAQCVDDDGNITAPLFPDNINELPHSERYRHFSFAGGERIGCRAASIMKENLFPEPEGVKNVSPSLLWTPMERKYLSWGINDVLRIFHQDQGERMSIMKGDRRGVQKCKNILYADSVRLSHPEIYFPSCKEYVKAALRYLIHRNLLSKAGEKDFADMYRPKWKPMGRLLAAIAYIPCLCVTPVFRKRRCSF